jgi:hypothetical protein
MKIGYWARLLLMATPLLAGCAGFWDAPSSGTSFTLSSSGNISFAPGATAGNTSTITVTPANSFTGTVSLACAVTTSPSGATNPATCSLSPTSVSISSTAAQTSTLTVTTASSTTTGAYDITVTGTSSGSTSETTLVCAEVSTSGTCSAAASSSSNFYILNASSIAGYSIASSALAPISGSSYTLGGATASSIAIGPSGDFLYVDSDIGIIPFTINTSTGALTQGTAFGDQLGEAIAVDPSGRWLLEASDAGVLYAYPITSTGAQDTSRQTQTSIFLASNSVELGGIAISPNGALVAVALGQTGTQIFPFNANNASPIGAAYTPTTKPYGSSGSALAVAIDPQSRLLYIGETAAFNSTTNSGALRVFTIGSNSVSELNYTAPYAPAGTGPHAILPISTGGYVYVASGQSGSAGSITGYSVTTTALTPLSSTVATGTQPNGLAEDGTDGFVLAVSSSGTTFDAYTLDSSASGQLTSPITGSPVLSPIAIVATPQ